MSSWVVTVILGLGLAIVVVRRRSIAIALLGTQSLVLGFGALGLASERSSAFLVASLVLLTKALVVPALLYIAMRHTPEPQPVVAPAGPLMRLALAAAVALAASTLMPKLGLASAHTERTAMALLLVGMVIVIVRRPTLFQLIGLVVAENGLSLLAVSVPGGLSYVIELGALFDLVLVVTVASAFARRIHAELGTGDTDLLRELRD